MVRQSGSHKTVGQRQRSARRGYNIGSEMMKQHSFSVIKGRNTEIFHNWYIKYTYINVPGAPAMFGVWIGFEAKETPDRKRKGHFRYAPVNNRRAYSTSFGAVGFLEHPTEAIKIPSEPVELKDRCFDAILMDTRWHRRVLMELSYVKMVEFLKAAGVGRPGQCNCRGCQAYA